MSSVLRQSLASNSKRFNSHWAHIPLAPPDAILGLNVGFKKDTSPNKVNVGVGAYRTNEGKPYVLPVVQKAKEIILNDKSDNHEYAGIQGMDSFVSAAEKFCFGEDSAAIKDNRIASIQGLSGTGCLRVAGEFLTTWLGAGRVCYQPDPTWGNHKAIFQNAGMSVEVYRYYDRAANKLDFAGMLDDIKAAPDGAIILLHSCAHNPTGMDPSKAEWEELSAVFHEKSHIPFFDNAYQGFASGDAENDAYAIRKFVEEGHNCIVANSFSKNFGLYGERLGLLSFVCKDAKEKETVVSQLKKTVRPMYSNPPINGAKIVSTILNDPGMKAEFMDQCRGMADRINTMRFALKKALVEDCKSEYNWDHVTNQIGMFAFSGLNKEEVSAMINEHHIYMTADGRISMAGVTSNNVEYIAKAIHAVKGNTPGAKL